ncbi:MAG: acyl carrier protein [Cytophagales bacterium]|nr:MAG: acyl carrier protein [Cytophagales bacterium]
MKTKDEIQRWLQERIAHELQTSPDTVSPDTLFTRYGFDSVVVITLAVDLEAWLGVELDPTVIWEYPTIRSLTDWIVDDFFPAHTA